MSQIPVSAEIISDGVVIGARSTRLMELSRMLCACNKSYVHMSQQHIWDFVDLFKFLCMC